MGANHGPPKGGNGSNTPPKNKGRHPGKRKIYKKKGKGKSS